MIREIVTDTFFLRQKSLPAGKEDIPAGIDLMDTLQANRQRCVGMAANMIGIRKRIIIVNNEGTDIVMFNPVILRKEGPYEAEEGCLSLEGTRTASRYRKVAVEYTDLRWRKITKTFTGFTAQIIQHEMDHLEGILI